MFDNQQEKNSINPQTDKSSAGEAPSATLTDNLRKNAVEDMFAETEKKSRRYFRGNRK